jgi:hypothetical protein
VSNNTWTVDPAKPNATALPATVGLLPGGDQQQLLEVKVMAFRLGREQLDRRARLNFVNGRIMLLRMRLLRGCRWVGCPRDQTCGENGCEPILKNPDDLPEYQPQGGGPQADGSQQGDGGLKPPLSIGVPCASDSQCQSGHCADGVCCDLDCSADCKVCNLSGRVGTCSLAPAGTACGTPACGSSTTLVGIKACDALGNCTPKPDQDCFPYACDQASNACFSSCTRSTEDTNCHSYYGCDAAAGTCYSSCTNRSQCNSRGTCSFNRCVSSL